MGHNLPVRIRGVTYPSGKAAAEALGVASSTIASALARGPAAIERVGLGKGRPKGTSDKGGRPKKEFTIGPFKFPSQRAASRALGVNENYISGVLRVGGVKAKQALIRRFMELEEKRIIKP